MNSKQEFIIIKLSNNQDFIALKPSTNPQEDYISSFLKPLSFYPENKESPSITPITTQSYIVDAYGREAYSKSIFKIFSKLNEIVFHSGEEMWGNICYERKKSNTNFINKFPDQGKFNLSRRRNIARIAPHINSVFEIGFNAGHSAALWLTMNENIKYYGLDIANKKYINTCAGFMKDNFGDRFKFFIGDSTTEIKNVGEQINERLDLIHIDGGHSYEITSKDISSSINLSKKTGTRFILLDDILDSNVQMAATKFIINGLLNTESINGSWESLSNSLMRIV
tara:strand:- start:1134 stop:1979 length:846 start_codon:yes stop_codon:yes gene_type:complete